MTRFTLSDLEALLDRYGADPHAWPRGSADRVTKLCADDAAARALMEASRALDADLAALTRAEPADAALIGRVLSSVRDRRAAGTSLMAFFTPVRMAALAGAMVGCIALGATLGLMVDQSSQSSQFQGEEVASLVLGVGSDFTFETEESL
ncbi:hypothetical protein [Amorphus sp. 3PC139-8]|uniref:hypothetical protein n=1 Tax=Amorphus sp. 3PC139-8 TaxID=2735676 RepID=UPI00345DAEC7